MHVHKQFGHKVLFEDISLEIGVRDRVGLIGPNGSGKTTLFRMILGEESLDGGEISIAKGVKMGYLPQEVIELRGATVLAEVLKGAAGITSLQDKMRLLEEEWATLQDQREQERLAKEYGKLEERYAVLGGYGLESEAKKILKGLGFKEGDFQRLTDELSGGWLMRVALAKILLQGPDLLLLDEPTNYLDLESLKWIEGFLSSYPGSIVLVSHDRVFLNHVVDRIIEIEGQKVALYFGNYDHYLEEKENRRRILRATFVAEQKKIEQTERFIERFRSKNTKARQVQSRIKRLEKMERIELPKEEKEIRFRFPAPKRSGHRVIEVKNLHKSYGPREVYRGVDLVLYRGDKVALVGPNGAGKSTLLRILAGVLDFEAGEVILGKEVTRAYFAQHQLDLLQPEHTVYEEIRSMVMDQPETQIRALLGAFLFSGEDVEKKVSVLSGGEKSRLVLAKMLVKPANFLLLDEPTSHLDIPSRNVLEVALGQFQGTLCFITHDRHLMNTVANKVIEIDGGIPRLYLGNYDDYLHQKSRMAEEAIGTIQEGLQPSRRSSWEAKEQRRRLAREQDEYRRQLASLRKRFQETEISLQEATEELDRLNHRLSAPSLYQNQRETYETLEAHRRAKQRVEELSCLWETLAFQLEELKKS